jgi:hypothetical protein
VSRGSWEDDYRRLSRIDPAVLAAEELESLADAAWMVCRLEESMVTRQKAYVRYLETRENRPAARVAWRLFWDHLDGGETVVAMGWLRRARRHLASIPEEAEHRSTLPVVVGDRGAVSRCLMPLSRQTDRTARPRCRCRTGR